MTSHNRVVAVGLALLVAQAALAEGSFFKDRRDAAAQAKPSAPPVRPAPQVQAPPSPAPVAREVEPSDARPATEQPTPREQPAPPPPEQHSSGTAQTSAPPTAPADISGQVSEVPTTDTLVVAGQRVTLTGVRGVSEMAPPLQRWIASTGGSVTCRPVASRYRCTTANGSDVGQIVLQNGGGTATPDAPANYRGAEMQARMGHRGIWRQR